jgi:hypothetical protein
MGIRPKAWAGVIGIASPNISPDVANRIRSLQLSRTAAVPSRLALSRLRFAANGIDGPPPARRGSASEGLVGTSRSLPQHRRRPLANGATRDLFAAADSVVRGHEQKTSLKTLGTRLGPGLSLAPPWFLCSARGAVSPPDQSHAEHRAQAAVNDRASDRDTAPKASLTVASTMLLF